MRPKLLGVRKFLDEFKPIESVVDGLPFPRGSVVAVTGPTGHGKTTIAALLQTSLRMGRRFAGREVTPGSVLVLAGENPYDYAMHLMATFQQEGIKREEVADLASNTHLMVVPGVFHLMKELEWLDSATAHACENLVAVFVDTSAAFFMGEEENNNVEMRRHASALRELTTLPGNPTVFVLCHPTKNATKESLLPRGGGAFLAEIDANLTMWKDEAGIVTLHWAGKIRGAPFDPIRFELVPVLLEGQLDCRGRPISSVAARHLSEEERAEQLQDRELADEDRLLVEMEKNPGASVRHLAYACNWLSGDRKALSTKVLRRLKTLMSGQLVEQDRKGKWRLSPKGAKEVAVIRMKAEQMAEQSCKCSAWNSGGTETPQARAEA